MKVNKRGALRLDGCRVRYVLTAGAPVRRDERTVDVPLLFTLNHRDVMTVADLARWRPVPVKPNRRTRGWRR